MWHTTAMQVPTYSIKITPLPTYVEFRIAITIPILFRTRPRYAASHARPVKHKPHHINESSKSIMQSNAHGMHIYVPLKPPVLLWLYNNCIGTQNQQYVRSSVHHAIVVRITFKPNRSNRAARAGPEPTEKYESSSGLFIIVRITKSPLFN